jgi:hypothetical protein
MEPMGIAHCLPFPFFMPLAVYSGLSHLSTALITRAMQIAENNCHVKTVGHKNAYFHVTVSDWLYRNA